MYILLEPSFEASMRTGVRQVLGIVAIMAIALHTALWGVAPVHVLASAVDPFSIICHSGTEAGDTAKEIPANPASTPSRPCDHCNLCGTAASPAVPPAIVGFQLLPARLLHELTPASPVATSGFEVASKGARGPPAFA